MLHTITQNEIQDILDQVMREITNRMTEIYPCKEESSLSNDVCTVHTTFEGGYCATLTMYVDTALLTRLTQQVMEEEEVSLQDVEDFAKEYFNIICGKIVAKLFQCTHVASRFRIPHFSVGRCNPAEGCGCCCVLSYASNRNEGAQLIHASPLP